MDIKLKDKAVEGLGNLLWNGTLLSTKLDDFLSFVYYRVSHGKVNKVIWLCLLYRFWFLLIFWVLRVHQKGTFMSNSSVFTFLKMQAIYGSVCKNLLVLSEFWIIGSFRGHIKWKKVTHPKLYIPSTINIVLIQWHTQLNVCAVK